MSVQLFLLEPRRWGLWSQMRRHTQGLYATLEDAIIKHQSGGRFLGGRLWTDVRWKLETAGLGKRAIEALRRKGFVRWEGDDLVVIHYDPTWEVEAAKRVARLSKRGKDAATARWDEVRRQAAAARAAAAPNFLPAEKLCDRNEDPPPASVTTPGTTWSTKLSPKPAESFDPPHASGIARGDARARLQLQEHDLWDPEPVEATPRQTDRPTPEDRACVSGSEGPAEGPVESVGWDSLSLGARTVWNAYPKTERPRKRLGEFVQLWRVLGLELHADWVLDTLSEFKLNRRWGRGFIPYADNWLAEDVRHLDRPVVDGCAENCCRGKWSKGIVFNNQTIKPAVPPPPPRPLTPEQIAEMKAQLRRDFKGVRH